MPAVVKSLSSYQLAVVDGITSLCTEIRNTQTAYKMPVAVDFNINKQLYRVIDEYICSITNSGGMVDVQPLVPVLGLTFIGATPFEAYFYSQANRKYYAYTGGTSIAVVDMIERFRNVTDGKFDFVNQEVVVPCLMTYDRLDRNVKDDEDEADNIIVPALKEREFIGEYWPPVETIFNNRSWYKTLSTPAGIVFQGPNRCIITRLVWSDYMLDSVKDNRGKWKKLPREEYHPFRKYDGEYSEVDRTVATDIKGWLHNPFLLVTAPLGLASEVDCLFEWEITFAWTVEMDRIYDADNYACVNIMSETMTPGGKVFARPTHVYLTKELFTRTGNYGYYSFRYQGKGGAGNRERLHIWSDAYIALSALQVEIKPVTERRNEIMTIQVDVQDMKEL